MKESWIPSVFDEFPSYKGGHTTIRRGYVFEFVGTHHLANQWGFVAQHRLVMEDRLGRQLVKGEVVHHRDECKTNNHPDNLQLMSWREHQHHHIMRNAEKAKVKLPRSKVEAALIKFHNLKKAARHLGIDPSTLYRRFPDLTANYKRRTPTRIDDPKAIALALQYAPDPNVQLRDVVKMTGMSAMTVLRICKRNGVKWVKKKRGDGPRLVYAGKPTRHALAMNGQPPAPAAQ